MWEFAKGNTFGATAFTSYGAFWLSFWWLTAHLADYKIPAADVGKGVGLYLIAWGIFTAYMTVAATRVSGAVLAVFVLLTITFFAARRSATCRGTESITKLGGYVGVAHRAGRLVRVVRRRHRVRVQAAAGPDRRPLTGAPQAAVPEFPAHRPPPRVAGEPHHRRRSRRERQRVCPT